MPQSCNFPAQSTRLYTIYIASFGKVLLGVVVKIRPAGWIAFSVTIGLGLAILLFGRSEHGSSAYNTDYPYNGLTANQAAAIIDHCNQKPRPWNC